MHLFSGKSTDILILWNAKLTEFGSFISRKLILYVLPEYLDNIIIISIY